MDLKQLMDPDFQMAQARYENYRIAVDKAYKMAEAVAEYNEYKFHSKALDNINLYTIEDVTPTARVNGIIETARLLIPAIFEDMEKAIKMLDKPKQEETDGSKTSPSALSRLT